MVKGAVATNEVKFAMAHDGEERIAFDAYPDCIF